MSRRENKTTPRVYAGVLYNDSGGFNVGSPEWWTWLKQEGHSTFYVETREGTFTARREWRRSGGRNVLYWYAYRRHKNKLHTVYLGKSEDLSLARLVEVARQLAEVLEAV